jgi:DNA (cytosine-5)-methyltransferase 1
VKPRALDLFCGAGGATRGLQLAGFHVTGVDIAEQPNYCGDDFLCDDATMLSWPADAFDFIWASPPCQSFTAYRRKSPSKIGASYPNLIPIIRQRLAEISCPTVIENVEGAPLESPVTLCGSMFGLDVRRHRLFECSFPVLAPECRHDLQRGDYPQATNRANRRKTVEVGVWRIPLETQKRAMGVDWSVTLEELSEAIPPAYSKFLGPRSTGAYQAEGRHDPPTPRPRHEV